MPPSYSVQSLALPVMKYREQISHRDYYITQLNLKAGLCVVLISLTT